MSPTPYLDTNCTSHIELDADKVNTQATYCYELAAVIRLGRRSSIDLT